MSKLIIKSYQLKPLADSLSHLYELDLSIRLSYKISKLKKAIVKHFEDFEEQRSKIIQKHSLKDEEGNPIIPKDEDGKPLEGQVEIENMEKFYSDLSELGKEEIQIELATSITLQDFEDEDFKLKPNIIEGLLPLLDLDEENN